MRPICVFPALLLALAIVRSAAAEAPDPAKLAVATDGAVGGMIQPAYAAFAVAAGAERDEIAALCAAPSGPALADARAGFLRLAQAFAAVEPFRFGPARRDNRFSLCLRQGARPADCGYGGWVEAGLGGGFRDPDPGAGAG